jgi:hypothetical protein
MDTFSSGVFAALDQTLSHQSSCVVAFSALFFFVHLIPTRKGKRLKEMGGWQCVASC